jgi:hypothetical protein
MFPQGLAVGHGEQSDSLLAAVGINQILDVAAHGAGALVQNGERRLVVQETGHLHMEDNMINQSRKPLLSY